MVKINYIKISDFEICQLLRNGRSKQTWTKI